jgi:hypothetical protein
MDWLLAHPVSAIVRIAADTHVILVGIADPPRHVVE